MFESACGGVLLADKKIDIISDVDLKISVELGRVQKRFKEILEMGPGTVVELDTSTGDRIDFLVNNQLVAKGEVMVVDGKFALRVTNVVGNITEAVKKALEERMGQ